VGEKGGYSLEALMAKAWTANPNWGTYAANHAEAHAALVEACAFPNPELETEFGSESSDESGDSRTIWTLGFSQPIELPGKRAARRAEALAGFPVVQREAAEYASSLRSDVREAYWTVQYHAALEQMHAAQVSLTKSQLEIAQKRQELGDAGKIEVTNARVEYLKSSREMEVARRRKLGAMAALNALAGGALGGEFRLSQNFPHVYGRPALQDAIRLATSAHPRLARLAAELEQKYASIQRQNREWWPDVKVGARKSKEFDGGSAAVTAGIEIPLWNRNEGGIARAEADAQKVYAQIGIAYNELRRDVEVAYQSLMIGREQIGSFEDGLKGAAEEAVDLAWEQFNLGGGTYLDILIARRQLLEIQQGYIQALYETATARARFDQALGR
jgi:cobalt-zinc-cadmium efflux system outer membrane protein